MKKIMILSTILLLVLSMCVVGLDYDVKEDKPTFGICVALQTFFEGSEESPGVAGLGVIPGQIKRFDDSLLSVPQIGWNGVRIRKPHPIFSGYNHEKFYFVHSYYACPRADAHVYGVTEYDGEFCSALARDNLFATQFHLEKSGQFGLSVLARFSSWAP